VCAWDPLNATLLFTLKGHMEFHAVSSLVMNEQTLFTSGWDGVVLTWSVGDLQQKVRESKESAANAVVPQKKAIDAAPVKASSSCMFDDADIELLD